MIDKITVVHRRFSEISDAAQAVMESSLSSYDGFENFPYGTIDVIPHPGKTIPVRPFLHRGDWVDDGRGNLWTVVTALLHEDDDKNDEDGPYLWHEYEVVEGMRKV
jgi:hypothetical protein